MSTEHLNNETTPSPDSEWEAAALSFAENTNTGKPIPKPSKKKRFHRRTLSVILTSAGTLLLACVILIVSLLEGCNANNTSNNGEDDTNQSTQTDSEDSSPSITLLDKTGNADKGIKAARLSYVDIKNKSDNYRIRYDDDAKAYVIQGYEDIDLDSSLVATLRNYTETIKATAQVNNVTNLAAFGLDEPEATATITYSDESSATIRIGDLAPSKTGYYCQLEGDDGVYILDTNAVTLFRAKAPAFASTLLISTPTVKSDDKNGMALLRNVSFSGTAFPTPLSLRRSNHNDSEELSYFAYLITAPYLRATRDTVANALGQFKSLSAEQALYLHPSAEQKKNLGFDKPLTTINVTMSVETETKTGSNDEVAEKIYYNSAEYKITIGSTDANGNYLVMMDGIDAIFLVSKATYGYLFDLTYESAVNGLLFVQNIVNISRINIIYNGISHDFTLTHYPNQENVNDQLVVKEGDKVYSTEDFRNLYSLMLMLERYKQVDSKPDSDVPLEMALYDMKGNLYLSAKYYNATGSLCVVETSEGELFSTRWSDVSFFLQQVDNYLNGRKVLINT